MKYIDYELAMEYLGDNERLFKMVSESFLESYRRYEENLLKLYVNKHYFDLYHEMHNLKGISLNFGAKALYDVSCHILDSMKQDVYDEKELYSYLNCFKQTYKELLAFSI